MSTREERRKEIGKLIWDAIEAARGVDWKKSAPEIATAETELEEAMFQYVDGASSKASVQSVYKRWRDLHKTGELFQ